VKPTDKTKKTLAKKGKATVKVTVTFKTTGGSARSQTKKIKLIETIR
jgi:hypothetical protein